MLNSDYSLKAYMLMFLLLVIGGSALANYEHLLEEKTFAATSGGKLRIEAPGSDLKVEGWGSDEIHVKIYGEEKCREKFEISYDSGNNSLYIKVKRRGGTWTRLFNTDNCGLLFDVKVPRKFHTNLETAGGDVKLSDVSGDQKLTTAGGDIVVKYSSGKLVSSTAGGDIIIDKFDGPVRANTSGGDIKAKYVVGDINLSTSGGDIEIASKSGKIEAGTTGGDIKAAYEGENKGIWLSSTGGDIELRMKSEVKASVWLSSSGGDVECDLNTTRVRKASSHKFEAEINGGGPDIKISTTGGDIKVWNN